jgi:hypothetical protein
VTDVANDAAGLDEQLVHQLTERARAEGLRLTGEGGLLARLTKVVVESSLEGELDGHLGRGREGEGAAGGGVDTGRVGVWVHRTVDRRGPGRSPRELRFLVHIGPVPNVRHCRPPT